jgi:hypothetical protein
MYVLHRVFTRMQDDLADERGGIVQGVKPRLEVGERFDERSDLTFVDYGDAGTNIENVVR